MKAIAAGRNVAVIFPVHPSPHVRSAMEPILGSLDNVALIDPLDCPHFVRLLSGLTLVLTDRGADRAIGEQGHRRRRQRACR